MTPDEFDRIYRKRGRERDDKGIAIVIAKMAAMKLTADEIAGILELDVELVRLKISNPDQK
jgi:hypothetical protein